jgi:hypothetical protein
VRIWVFSGRARPGVAALVVTENHSKGTKLANPMKTNLQIVLIALALGSIAASAQEPLTHLGS